MGREAFRLVDLVGKDVDFLFCWLLFSQGNNIKKSSSKREVTESY